MLRKTKNFLKANGFHYKKNYVSPLIAPENYYVLRFGRNHLNNRYVVQYSYTWTGRMKISSINLRLHGQKRPRIFKNETQLLAYLRKHLKLS
ncbi:MULTISPECIES: hypothetical protein [Loigolactobacillus]|uniref:Uncharacterized protein n=1 Tax=Loigolactobacillus backii TaxID=375175 RepID=A0A192GYA3_9LACO|nr:MULTISPECIES: hypothetical protein [Loigolactobacillus]ANK58843.1 hypothetical protein AYR52_00330 [Loigolactobacillus backii]ANK61494.1 hypothetical protein AYR53_01180 [Loigolactobacillus backii]ANK63833.1 hypothetical protein AYR54_00325 [Loigolactobacillus backii]ANK66281.1 hypothetical protein AYR55_00325 [Loigolactobacillus backii]ANK69307.1 hypothetical protein AYR56_03535 [Loigolactobacillus backii]